MVFEALTYGVMAAFIVGAAIGVARSYRTLSSIERVVLWWWTAIGVLILTILLLDRGEYVLIGIAGVLMLPLGVLIALNVRDVATRLSRRKIGIGPIWQQQSAAHWRFSGAFLALVGAFFTLAFASVF